QKAQVRAEPYNKPPISVESFDQAYDRHMRQVHEQLEHSRRQAQRVSAPTLQSERAAPPPPPKKKYVNPARDILPDETFLEDEASEMARQTVANTAWGENTERVVVQGSLGVHSSMENTAKDRIAREEHLRDNLDDSQNLFPAINFEKIADFFRFSKKPPVTKPKEEPSIPKVNPERLAAVLGRGSQKAFHSLRALLPFMLLLIYQTLGSYTALPLPGVLNFGTNYVAAGIVGMVLFLVCLVIGRSVLSAGFGRLLRLKPDLDSVIALSSVFTFLLGFLCLVIPAWRDFPVPLSLPVLAIFLRILSRRLVLITRHASVKSVSRYTEAETLLLSVDGGYDDCPTYLRTDSKGFNRFYHGLRTETLGDRIMGAYSRVCLILVLPIAILSAIFPPAGHHLGQFFYMAALLLAVIPNGTLVLFNAYAYFNIAKRMRAAGAYPGGMRSFLAYSREGFTVVSDRDLYPDDTVSITDFKLLASYDRKTVFQYAASLLSAVNCSLAAPFVRVMKDEYMMMSKVTNIRFTGEAISAEVDGHHIIIGDDAAMRRAGFRVTRLPTRLPVYIAIDAELACVFALNYAPAPDTEYSLRLLIHYLRIPVISALDFNITVDRVEKSFRIRPGVIVCPPIETRVALANPDRAIEATGVVFLRSGIRPMAETIEGSRRFRTASTMMLLFGMASGLLGVILAAVMGSNGWFASANGANLLLYQLLWLVPGLILSLWAKKY
ncbi:MAG: hypothetical protein IKZ21_05170, partial [Clostridia bacterium]|nr:hypothetical protein [Clostridia bacterium]